MNVKTFLRKRKAISSVLGAVLLIGITVAAVGILYSVLNVNDFNANVASVGAITAEDYDNDGLIDKLTIPLINSGMSNALIDSVQVVQGENVYLWYTFATDLQMSSMDDIEIYALGELQQIKPFETFYVEIIFADGIYTSAGYVALNAAEIPAEIIPTINGGNLNFEGFDFLVMRTAADDEYASKNFPTEVGFSPKHWFLLGEFDEDNKRPDINTDYIDLCGHGNELEYQPYLLDENEFRAGSIGTQTNYKVTPYLDEGEHPGLISFNKYGNWDKKDYLNYGKYGVVYMWTYIYVDGDEEITVNLGANGASEFKVWLNGDYQLAGNNKKSWYVSEGATLNPGLNIILMKLSAKVDAHFAGQILLFNSLITDQLANLYSVWPSIGDL
ncbi:MAG: archaellin/type IV pilin N-terminal domain-containing protein [Candidatus Thorarchaeota archaeon]